MKNTVIIGPPGSGKDTQIDELAKYNEFVEISAGDIARALAKKNDKIRKIMEEGGLIDDAVILAEIDKKIASIDANMGIVFDGFPRTMHQAEALAELLLHHGRNMDAVIYISLDEDEIVRRLTTRKVCSLCGHDVRSHEDSCSLCSGEPTTRSDDKPVVIINRVQTFLENTLPLVDYYRNKGIIIEIDGNQSIEAVASDIKKGISG